MKRKDELLDSTSEDVRRLQKREKQPATLIGLMLYGGVLGILFVVPLVGGAYLGRWLDSLAQGYSVRWTLSLIVLGIALGIYNVIHFLRGRL